MPLFITEGKYLLCAKSIATVEVGYNTSLQLYIMYVLSVVHGPVPRPHGVAWPGNEATVVHCGAVWVIKRIHMYHTVEQTIFHQSDTMAILNLPHNFLCGYCNLRPAFEKAS